MLPTPPEAIQELRNRLRLVPEGRVVRNELECRLLFHATDSRNAARGTGTLRPASELPGVADRVSDRLRLPGFHRNRELDPGR